MNKTDDPIILSYRNFPLQLVLMLYKPWEYSKPSDDIKRIFIVNGVHLKFEEWDKDIGACNSCHLNRKECKYIPCANWDNIICSVIKFIR